MMSPHATDTHTPETMAALLAAAPEPLNNLLYAGGSSVRHVMTDGVFQVHEGRFVADDEAAVIRKGGEAVAKIWKRLGEEGWFKPTAR